MLTKTKMNLFYKYEYKNKIKLFFSHNKIKFQPRTYFFQKASVSGIAMISKPDTFLMLYISSRSLSLSI